MTLPTIIVRHPSENPRKCSVMPLRGRADLVFLHYPVLSRPDVSGYIRLSADGPALSARDADRGIVLLDGSWRWARAMERAFSDVPPRSLSGWKTAYPRVSKLGTDPDNGLASVEALYLAHHILGRRTEGLLDHYRWANRFLELNHLARPSSLSSEDPIVMAAKHSPRFLKLVEDTKSRIRETSVASVKERLDRGERLTILDVREESEFGKDHLPGAVHLGKGILERDVEERFPDTSCELILYCGGGFRSALAADNLQRMGYTNVLSMDGGIRDWREKGFPLTSS